MEKIAPYYKAVVGALVAFLAALSAGLEDNGLTTPEWLTAIIALLIGGLSVFTIPNIIPGIPTTQPVADVPEVPLPEVPEPPL